MPNQTPEIDPDRHFFGTKIEQLRLARGLTQTQLAELSGVSQPHVSALERGLWDPRLGTLLAMARALNVEPADLLPPAKRRRK